MIENIFFVQNYIKRLFNKNIATKILTILISITYSLYLSNVFGSTIVGIIAVTFTLCQLISFISKMGLDWYSMTEIAKSNDRSKTNNSYWISLYSIIFTAAFFSTLFFFFSNFVSQFFFDDVQYNYIAFSSFFIIPIAINALNVETFKGLGNINSYTIFVNGYTCIALVITPIIFFFCHTQIVGFICYYVSILINALISTAFLFRKANFNFYLPSIKEITQAVRKSWYIMVSEISIFLISSVTILILGKYQLEKDVGIYSTTYKIINIAAFGIITYENAAVPLIIKNYQEKNFLKLQGIVREVAKSCFYITIPIIFILVFFGKLVLSLFGKDFIDGYYCLLILCISMTIRAIMGPIGVILQSTDNQKLMSIINFVCLILNIILSFLLIPNLGITGAAIATSISHLVQFLSVFLFVKKKYNFYNFYLPLLWK